MRTTRLAMLVLAAVACFAGAAQAQQCPPLTRAFSMDLFPVQGDTRYTIGVTVNNTPRRFLLDTGGAYTQLSVQLVTNLGIGTRHGNVRMYDAQGRVSDLMATVDLGLGPVTAKAQDVPVNPGLQGGGILAGDVMQNYDIDIDFAGRKLSYFLPTHCDGKVIYWQTPIVASVPFHGWTRGQFHLYVPVKIDGHEVTAWIDTGATGSTLDANTARQLFDLTPETPGVTEMGTMGGDKNKTFSWTFKTLEIGGIKINTPKMRIIPDLMGKGNKEDIAADSHIRMRSEIENMGPTMLIGMDVLRKLHLYIASKEGKLYVTPASDLPPDPAPAAASAAAPAQPAGN